MTDIVKRLRIVLPEQSEGQKRLEEEAAQEIERLQAKIDSLMLEYCPNDMTLEQIANYECHQKAVSNEI